MRKVCERQPPPMLRDLHTLSKVGKRGGISLSLTCPLRLKEARSAPVMHSSASTQTPRYGPLLHSAIASRLDWPNYCSITPLK